MRKVESLSRRKRSLNFLVVVGLSALVILGSGVKKSAQPNLLLSGPAIAQNVKPRDIWQQVYQKLPDLPMENQYVNKETGEIDSDNNLVNRLLRYHIYVKGRPANYRLDWKLTMADYLGANELMEETVYPGYDTLRQNPIEGDRAAIGRLNRKQRDALVQTLVNIFNSNDRATPAPAANASPEPSTAPSTGGSPVLPQPQPGDAQLLMP